MKAILRIGLAWLALLLLSLPAAQAQMYEPNGTTVAGGNGSDDAANQLYFPANVFVDATGNVYVADRYNNRIQKWAPGATEGTTVAGGNGSGDAADQLDNPSGVAVDATGNVYVADRLNHRIQKWAPGATEGTTVAGGNGYGDAANRLANPWGLFVDATGNVYVADSYNHRIQKWAPGATEGTTVAGGNGSGDAADQLYFPYGVSADATGNVYVADQNNDRIQKWAPGATVGTTVAGGNGSGGAADQLNNPHGLFVDATGNVYVADWGNHRIQKWAPGATEGATVAGGNGTGDAADQLYFPYGVFVDATGNFYVADQTNHRIQKFTLAAPTVSGLSASPDPVCAGQGVQFTATVGNVAGAAYDYTLSNGAGSTLTGNGSAAAFSQSLTASGSGSQTYTLTVTATNGTSTTSTTLTVNPLPTAGIGGNNGPVCAGGDATFTVSGTSGATLTYTITGQSGNQTLLLNGGNQTITVSGATANATLTLLSVTKEGCSQNLSATSTVTVNALPTASIGGNNGPVCAGGDATFSVSGTSGATLTYTLTGQSGNQTLALNGGNQTITVSGATANATLTLLSVTKEGCSQNLSATSTVTVNALPTASIGGNNGPVCAGGDATFSVSGTSGATLTYTLTGQSGNQTLLLNGGNQTITASGATANATLTLVSVANSNCSQNLSGTSTVTVNPLPTASIGGNNGPVCAGGDATFSVSGTSGATLTYFISGLSGSQTLTLNGSNQTITASGATANAILTLVSIANSSCSQNLTGTSTVTVNPLPTASIATNNGPVCAGGDATFTVSGTSGATLTYTLTGQSGNQTLALNGSNQTITASGATSNATLTLLSVTKEGCSQNLTATSTVTFNPLPTASIGGNNGPVCAGGDATFSVSGTSGATLTYTLTGQSGNQTLLLNGGSQTITASGATSNAILTLVSVANSSCSQNLTGTSTVIVNALPTVNAGPDQSVVLGFGSNCTNLSATPSGGSGNGYNYTWNPGNLSGQTVNVCPIETTTYTVTLTDANGCQATDQVTVNVQDVRCGPGNKNVQICYYGVTQCVSEKIAKNYIKLGATLGACGSSANTRTGYEAGAAGLSLTLKAYPNPVQDLVTLEVQSPVAGPARFEVLNAGGQAVQQKAQHLSEGLNEVPFELGAQPAGNYLIRCVDMLGRQAVVRVNRQ